MPSPSDETTRLAVVVIARDEEDRLPSTLASVRFADEIVVVVDDATRDLTAEIARAAGATVLVRGFDTFGGQKNAGADAASADWVLSLDADEVVSEALAAEIRTRIAAPGEAAAFRVPIRLEFMGRALRFGRDTVVRPVRLYRRSRARFSEDPVHERVRVDGRVGRLTGFVRHRSYRDLAHYLEKLDRYTTLAADARVRLGKKVPRFVAARVAWELLDRAVLRLGFLDGLPGLTFAALSAANTGLKFAKHAELEKRARDGARA